MKILADANPAFTGQLTGIGIYTHRLLGELAKLDEVTGFTFNYKGAKNITARYPVIQQTKIPGKALSYPRHLNIDLPLKLFFDTRQYDIVLGTNYLLPTTGSTPNVATFHDVCFLDHPEWVQGSNARILRKRMGATLRRSSGLITISEFSAERIKSIYGYKKPILVVGIPPQQIERPAEKPTVLKGIKDKSFFLFVSTIEPRKNIKVLLDAFELLPKQTQTQFPLVLAGKPGWDPEVLTRLRSKSNPYIMYLDYVSDTEKKWLYEHATATIIPSHYEGFGMMTLESLHYNTPTITSDIAPQREILGEHGLFFKPDDVDALKNHMVTLTDSSLRELTLSSQRTVLKNYSWEKTAKEVHAFLKGVLDHENRH